MDKVPTGIEGFDDLVDGGFPAKTNILLSGTPGTGKTIFGLQYLVNGANEGEKGLFVTLEESKEFLIKQAGLLNFNLGQLIDEDKIQIFVVDDRDLEKLLNDLRRTIREGDIKRMVFDSLPMLSMFTQRITQFQKGIVRGDEIPEDFITLPPKSEPLTRSELSFIIKKISQFGSTNLLITETSEKEDYLSRDTISEFLCDGVIMFHYMGIGGTEARSLQVRKMRLTKTKEGYVPYEIGDNGITVKADDMSNILLR
jgi:circadian clock protein KaiC